MEHSSTLFSQLLRLIDRLISTKPSHLARDPSEDSNFQPLESVLAMMFVQIIGRSGLRDIVSNFGFQSHRLNIKAAERYTEYA